MIGMIGASNMNGYRKLGISFDFIVLAMVKLEKFPNISNDIIIIMLYCQTQVHRTYNKIYTKYIKT